MRSKLFLALLAALSMPLAAQNSRPTGPAPDAGLPDSQDRPYPGVLTLAVDASDTQRGVFRVRQTIPVAGPGKLTLVYPKWLPGNHAPTGPIGALAGLRVSAGGRPLAWQRNPIEVHAFDIEVPAGARRIDLSFEFLSPTRDDQGRVVITPQMLNLQWEKVALYPAGHYTRQVRIRPSVTLPAGWTGVSAVDGRARRGGRIEYPETDFETLVDSPMFAGRHFREWNLGQNVDLNVWGDRAEDLDAKPEHIAAHRRLVEQTVKAFGSRHFDRYDFLLATTDEMSYIGLEHHRSSENAVPRGYFTKWDEQGSTRGLLPHEFEHSWNGKFRRPADNWAPDFHRPIANSLLWVYEGQTSYWDLVLGARSGMQPREVVLGEFASTAALYGLQSGRAWRPLLDTTNQPIVGYGRPQAYATYQRGTDYYSESALIWLEVDMLIREKTRGRRSMDDFARAFFGMRNGDWGQLLYTRADVIAALNSVVAHDWAGFIAQRIDRPAAAPIEGIRKGGYRLVWKDTPNAYDVSNSKRRKTLDLSHSIGLVIGKAGALSSAVWDSPAFNVGLNGNATIVAVNGREYSDEELTGAIAAAKGGREPIRLLVKEGARYRNVDIAYHGGLRWPHLEKVGRGPAMLDRLLEPLK